MTIRWEAFALPDTFGPAELRSLDVVEGVGGEPAPTYVVPELTPESVTRLARVLRTAGAALTRRPVTELADALGRVGERFGDAADPIREEALALLPGTAGVSPEMAHAILDGMAPDWTRDRLHRLVQTEFEDVAALDGFVTVRGRTAMAVGPGLCVQIVSGSVPGVGVNALIRSLILKGPTLLKPGLGDAVLPVLFARALREEDAALADALAVVYWPGGSTELERAALGEADVITVYGSDATVSALRSSAPVTARFVGYRHRVGVGIVGRDALTPDSVDEAAAEVASAVAMFDQRGCVCPQVVYVEERGEITPADFAERLATALAEVELRLPCGRADVEDAAALHQLRGNAELHAAAGRGVVYHGGDEASWTVVYESEPMPGPACLLRSVRVKPLGDAEELAEELGPVGPHLQTIVVAGLGDRARDLAITWGRLGASRIVPFRDASFPPPWWLHDGRGPLQDLVRWVEVEAGSTRRRPAAVRPARSPSGGPHGDSPRPSR